MNGIISFTFLKEKVLKIYRSEKEISQPAIGIGGFETDSKTYLKFACADGYILIKELQWEGKKRMMVEEFLRGFRK